MVIKLNNEVVTTPTDDMTVLDLLKWRNVHETGTAVAINSQIIAQSKWDITKLQNDDNVLVISAAFGG
ncbi:MAG: sulfur carrier protein ThiS [Lepagella sp.]